MPFLRAQLIQLRLLCILIRKELDHIERSRQHIQTAATLILDLHIVFPDVLHFHFFNAAVDTHTVVFMDHVIPDMQFRIVPDLLAAGILRRLFAARLPLGSEDIRLGDHREFYIRIGKAFADAPVEGHDLPGLQDLLRILGIGSYQILLQHIIRQTLRTCSGCTEDHNLILVFFQLFQVADQSGKAVVIGSQSSRMNRKTLFPVKEPLRRLHRCQLYAAAFSHLCQSFFTVSQKCRLPRQHVALLQAVDHALAELRFHAPYMFHQPYRLIQEYQRPFFSEEFQKCRSLILGIKVMQVAFQIQHAVAVDQLVFQLIQLHLDPVRFLRLHRSAEFFPLLLCLCLDPVKALVALVLRQDHFRRRKDRHGIQCLDGALAFHVKTADRIHRIAPQFDTVGVR